MCPSQECSISPEMQILQMWDVAGVEFHRSGGHLVIPSTGVSQPIYFKTKDGYVMILLQGGNDPFVTSSRKLVEWMTEEGIAPEWLQSLDWEIDYNASTMGQEIADRTGKAVEKFTLTKTKSELYIEGAMGRGILIAPENNTKDISEDLQLEARVYWREIEHPELHKTLTYCGPFVRMSETPIGYKMRAPLIGEHNRKIYIDELGLSEARFDTLKNKGLI